MAEITDTGAVGTTLEGYLTILEDLFQSVFGDDFDVSSETPQGQIIGLLALILAEADEGVIDNSNGTSIFRASGQQLDGLTAILSTLRDEAERSQVTVNLTGVPTSIIPAGSRAKTDNDDVFVFDEDVQLDGAGLASATMFSVETGQVPALAGQLVNIVDVVPGWETVTNPADASLGQDREVDQLLVLRYFRELFRNAVAVRRSVEGAVSALEGVTDVIARENDTDAAIIVQNVSIPPHSIAVVVAGGGDIEIAEAIALKKTGGTGTTGLVSILLPDRPSAIPIEFYRPDPVYLEIKISTELKSGFPGNGIALIKQRIEEYFRGEFVVETDGFFETDGIKIAESLNLNRLFTPINSVPGHDVTILDMNLKSGGGPITQLDVDLDEKIDIEFTADITITIV